jgi:hypothetical protein
MFRILSDLEAMLNSSHGTPPHDDVKVGEGFSVTFKRLPTGVEQKVLRRVDEEP